MGCLLYPDAYISAGRFASQPRGPRLRAGHLVPGFADSPKALIFTAMTSAAWTIGVFIIPGRIEFARIPDRAYWRAITRVK